MNDEKKMCEKLSFFSGKNKWFKIVLETDMLIDFCSLTICKSRQ